MSMGGPPDVPGGGAAPGDTDPGALQKANNLSDVPTPSSARVNLGLGSAATANKVAAGNAGVLDATDATTTNARTPTGHAASHAYGGTDAMSVALGFYGDGSDGPLHFDGAATVTGAGGLSLAPAASVYTLTRDIFATTFLVDNGVTIKTNGWRIYASVSVTNNGTIQNLGLDAAGATGGAAAASNSLNPSGAGATGGTGVGPNGSSSPNSNAICIGGNGGSGGGGGSGAAQGSSGPGGGSLSLGWGAQNGPGGGTGGSGGSAGGNGGSTTLSLARGLLRMLPSAVTGASVGSTVVAILAGAAGGGAGGGDGSNNGGGGGSGGGALLIASPLIDNTNGTISVRGGNGAAGVGGNAGGGGAGGGGSLMLTGKSVIQGTLTVSGGTHGAGTGTGRNGGDGPSGSSLVQQYA